MRRLILTLIAGAIAAPASASLVYDSNVQLSAQGFGNAPRDLTVQAHGSADTESGCVGVGAGGGIRFGSCVTNAQVHDSNGLANVGGDEPSPQADDQKYGIPTVSELGWASAADIGILFNATEPQNDTGGINVQDLTLKFYDALTGNLVAAIDGSHDFAGTNAGNGVAGFTFVVDGAEQSYLNGLIFNGSNLSNIRIALEATLDRVGGGPDTFRAVNLERTLSVPEPATWGLMMLGFGAVGIVIRRRRRGGTLMQIA
jgi:hypothetical protein